MCAHGYEIAASLDNAEMDLRLAYFDTRDVLPGDG